MKSSTVASFQPNQPGADHVDFAHTGPGTLAGRYMRSFWQPVRIAAELKPGRPMPIKVMNEDFVLYRGASGQPHLMEPRCPHRRALLHTGWVEGECIRCFYHGWKFDESGQCVETPGELPSFPPTVKIRSYPAEEYLGLIFAYLGEGEPPPMPRYPQFEEPGVLDVTQYIRLCNYFNNVENNVDPAHTPFTHAVSGYTDQGLSGIPEVTGHESDWGITQYGKRPDGGTRVSQHGMPNILNLKFQPTDGESGWKELITWRIPIDDEHHVAYLVNHVKVTGDAADRYRRRMAERNAMLAALEPGHLLAARIVRGELRIEDVLDRPDLLEIQDHVAQTSQGIIADHALERPGRTDVLVMLLRRLWAREMRLLAEGRKMKDWKRPPDMDTTTGMTG